MMKVPGAPIAAQPAPPKVDDSYLMMAAAMMHSEGKFGPKPTADLPPDPAKDAK